MSNGIEKLGLVNPDDKNIIWGGGKKFPSYIKVKADCEVGIIAIKNSGFTDKRPGWIAKPREKRPFSSKHKNGHTGDIMGAKIEAKFCGPQIYQVEAFIGEPINKEPNRILIQGYAPEKITKAEWRKSKTGASLKTKPNKFGDDIWLHLETEGLNGCRLNIMVYNDQIGDDQHVGNYVAKCYGGEINLLIKDTYKWRAGTGYLRTDNEEYYIKVKILGKSYLIYNLEGQKRIAEFVVFKNDITKRTTEKSKSTLPAKVDQSEISLERYEPCRFKTITLTDEKNDIIIFDEGKLNIDQDKKKEFAVSEKIYFDFNKWDIKAGAKETLNNIATFLLDNPFVPVTLGAHCDNRGTLEYNDKLSKNRAIEAVDYLVSKGVSSSRITAKGYGERKPYIKGEDLTEAQHLLNRRVTIQFNIYGRDAESIEYSTVAPDIRMKKEILIKVDDYKVDKCLKRELTDKHDDQIYVIEMTNKGKSSPEKYNINHLVYSNLSPDTFLPLDHIWPLKSTTNNFLFYINSCRYYSDSNKATIVVKVYPDVKWELSAELAIGISNYKAANMPAGAIYKDHQEKSKKAGFERWQLNEYGKLPIDIGLGLSVEWNQGHHKKEYTQAFKKKIEPLASTVSKYSEILQNAINIAQSAAKATSIPVGFDIRYPKFKTTASWFLQRDENTNQIAIAGVLDLAFAPLIGAEIIIDIIGAAIAAISYGTTGNPAAAKLINKFRGSLDKLGASVTFTGTFYGELHFSVEAIKIDSINGINLGGKTTIGGRFGFEILLEFSLELGKLNITNSKPIAEFRAALKGDGYFGGEITIDSDDKGIFIEPILKFSGLKIVGEVEGEIGWWKSSFKMEEIVVPEEKKPLKRRYLI